MSHFILKTIPLLLIFLSPGSALLPLNRAKKILFRDKIVRMVRHHEYSRLYRYFPAGINYLSVTPGNTLNSNSSIATLKELLKRDLDSITSRFSLIFNRSTYDRDYVRHIDNIPTKEFSYNYLFRNIMSDVLYRFYEKTLYIFDGVSWQWNESVSSELQTAYIASLSEVIEILRAQAYINGQSRVLDMLVLTREKLRETGVEKVNAGIQQIQQIESRLDENAKFFLLQLTHLNNYISGTPSVHGINARFSILFSLLASFSNRQQFLQLKVQLEQNREKITSLMFDIESQMLQTNRTRNFSILFYSLIEVDYLLSPDFSESEKARLQNAIHGFIEIYRAPGFKGARDILLESIEDTSLFRQKRNARQALFFTIYTGVQMSYPITGLFFMPLVIEMTHGMWNWHWLNALNGSSVGVFLSLLDPAIAVNRQVFYPGSSFSVSHFLSPGLFMTWNMHDIPVTLGLGARYSQQLASGTSDYSPSFTFFAAFDLAFMRIY